MRSSLAVILAVLVVFLSVHCSESTSPPTTTSHPTRTPAELTPAERSRVSASNAFGLRLFEEVLEATPADSNLFLSPLSVSYALAMAYNGAAGDTREAIGNTLELAGLSLEQANQAYLGLTGVLAAADPEVQLDIANSVWYQDYSPIKAEFVDVTQTYYDALVRQMESDAFAAADTINHWVFENTGGKIEDIVPRPVPRDVELYLINAVYFLAKWTVPFNEDSTVAMPFHAASGETECDMMTRETTGFVGEPDDPRPDSAMLYFENSLFQAVSLAYGSSNYRLTALLPGDGVALEEIAAAMTPEAWSSWVEGLEAHGFRLRFPRFRFSYETGLNDMLKAMGMEVAFDGGRADFSNMVAGGGIWIDTVLHKSFVQLDEAGTEAAAVTMISFERGLPEEVAFDRPFLFVIHERDSDAIVFMGKIARPIWLE